MRNAEGASREAKLGRHRLADRPAEVPPERELMLRYLRRYGNPKHYQWDPATREMQVTYHGLEAWEEMRNYYPEVLLPYPTRQWEFVPTWMCPEDCGGCPDRASLHTKSPPERRIDFATWKNNIDFAVAQGAEYLMLIGGTIDRMPVARRMMRYILHETSADAAWFFDGIIVTDWHTGQPNAMFEKWVAEAGILQATNHVSADYFDTKSLPALGGSLPSPAVRWDNSRWFKSAYGLNSARTLIERRAKRVVVNTTISNHNIDQVIPIYDYVAHLQEYAREIGSDTVVLWSTSPWQHYVHLLYGDDPANYDQNTILGREQETIISGISTRLVNDTNARLQQGRERVTANSSGYINALPTLGISQMQSFGGRMPGVGCFAPDGTFMPDPMAHSALELVRSELFRTSYGYTDRVPVGEGNVWTSEEKVASGEDFPNLLQSTKPGHGRTWR